MGANIPMEEKRMRHTSSSLPKAMALVLMVMVGVAVMASTDSARTPATAQPGLVASVEFAPCDVPGALAPQSEALTTVVPDQETFAPEPVAICRLLPECWANSDCDARCGAGLGKCVHSNCPVRRCR